MSIENISSNPVMEALRSIDARLESIAADTKAIRRNRDRRNDAESPWVRLAEARRHQVLRVRDTLNEHPSWTINRAAEHVFANVRGGYPSARSLAAYCYSIRLVELL